MDEAVKARLSKAFADSLNAFEETIPLDTERFPEQHPSVSIFTGPWRIANCTTQMRYRTVGQLSLEDIEEKLKGATWAWLPRKTPMYAIRLYPPEVEAVGMMFKGVISLMTGKCPSQLMSAFECIERRFAAIGVQLIFLGIPRIVQLQVNNNCKMRVITDYIPGISRINSFKGDGLTIPGYIPRRGGGERIVKACKFTIWKSGAIKASVGCVEELYEAQRILQKLCVESGALLPLPDDYDDAADYVAKHKRRECTRRSRIQRKVKRVMKGMLERLPEAETEAEEKEEEEEEGSAAEEEEGFAAEEEEEDIDWGEEEEEEKEEEDEGQDHSTTLPGDELALRLKADGRGASERTQILGIQGCAKVSE